MMNENLRERFDQLHRSSHESIYQLILKHVGNREVAEDLTLETFVNAYRAFPHLNPKIDVDNWLRDVAWNNCRNRFKRSLDGEPPVT